MKKITLLSIISISLFFCDSVVFAAGNSTDSVEKQYALNILRNLPLSFTENNGQYGHNEYPLIGKIRFQTHVGPATVFFGEKGISHLFYKTPTTNSQNKGGLVDYDITPLKQSVLQYDIEFLGGRSDVKINGNNQQVTKTNYFNGKEPNQHYTDVLNYNEIEYQNLYEKIDLKYYGVGGKLKYDFVVRGGGNVGTIKLSYRGTKGLSVNRKGQLEIKTAWGTLIEETPYSYQIIGGQKKEIKVKYKIEKDLFAFASKKDSDAGIKVGFEVEGEYDEREDLIIDPYTLMWSTFLGGNDPSEPNNLGQGGGYLYGLDVDKDGNVYVTGYTSNNFPTSANFPTVSYDPTFNGGWDAFVSKINVSGNILLYSTFLGGNGEEVGSSIKVNNNGEVVVAGYTYSKNFPVTSTAYDTSFNGEVDMFVTKMNAAGNELIYSTFLGGSKQEGGGSQYANGCEVSINPLGEVFLVGSTQSPDFPVTKECFDSSYNNNWDGFVCKLNATGSMLMFSTFLGGKGVDQILDVALDKGGDAYVVGTTSSADYPVSSGSYDTSYTSSYSEGFVTKLNGFNGHILYSTFLGSSITAVCIDDSQKIYVTGYGGSTFPTTDGAYKRIGNGDFVVVKMDEQLSRLIYSTFIGQGSPTGIAIDSGGKVFIVGFTTSTIFPVTWDAFQPINRSKAVSGFDWSYDLFLTQLSKDGSSLLYSTYIGGHANDYGRGTDISVDAILGIPGYVVTIGGTSHSDDFPTTPGAFMNVKPNFDKDCPVILRFNVLPGCLQQNPELITKDVINMGNISCNEAKDSILIIKDTVCADLEIDTLMLEGTDAANFKILSPTVFPFHLHGNSFGEIRIRFNSQGNAGTKRAWLRIHSNDRVPFGDTVRTIRLVGTVDSSNIVASIHRINFDTLRCVDSMLQKGLYVKNTGTGVAIVKTIIDGPDAAQFHVTPDNKSINAGLSTYFTVQYRPQLNGVHNARLLLITPCANDTVELVGVKKPEEKITSWPDIHYITCDYADSAIVVKNTGQKQVFLDPAVVSGNGFSLLSPLTAQTITPGDSIIYTIRFSPGYGGSYNGSFHVTGLCGLNASHSLSGRKDEIITSVNPSIVDLGVVGVAMKANGSTEYKNEGVPGVRVKEAYFAPNPFSGVVTTSLPKTLTPGESLPINFTVQPPATGSYSGIIHVVVDSPCYDEKNIVVTLEAITGCAYATAIQNKKPGEITEIPIVLENTEKIKNAKKISVEISYDKELLRAIDKEPVTNYGRIENYSFDRGQGKLSFTLDLTKLLDVPASEIGRFSVQALLAPHRSGEISIKVTVVGQNDNVFFSAECPTPFVLDESCILTNDLKRKNNGTISGIYPNPSRSQVTIEIIAYDKPHGKIEVIDMFGRLVEVLYNGEMDNEKYSMTVNTKNYTTGIYFCRLIYNKQIITKAFNVER